MSTSAMPPMPLPPMPTKWMALMRRMRSVRAVLKPALRPVRASGDSDRRSCRAPQLFHAGFRELLRRPGAREETRPFRHREQLSAARAQLLQFRGEALGGELPFGDQHARALAHEVSRVVRL